ncbi:hypothetical protein PGT21_037185 [Puccinia graminis f. sp. tritici]|uniref:Uncharacterized protein n=2 Tax=Puccinia graminis f. sp. tritici TaxID=56615 RepID=E3KIQ9_PUCGT|nr:uncharacterized protein PGTG_10562 [Puccinia graminis f. sp. tritici CRL 75-36-700-3]EFP84184.2 hypothetical protein PGTG_10562 [Puccinia graminis f. sp. tritici CRL 75-36-700-3]KAA1114142.1 hypothetical protein PGTUg99_024209 [Puccinia graminis f. sp. tritici]KAA1120130.1 hypothetical protein PGT21_037185 [Puccinia graminis f. sp. tritici]
MPKQDFNSGKLPGNVDKDFVREILSFILNLSPTPSKENIPAVIRDYLKSRFVSSIHAVVGSDTSNLITAGLILCFLSFIFQLTWFVLGLRYSRLSNSYWLVRNNELGVFVPNTRFLMAILSLSFTLLLVSETVLLILDINGISTFKDRTIIAGFKWMPLWLSSWVYVWGMGSSIYTTYSQLPKGIIGKLVGYKRSALAFNAMALGSLVLIVIYETATVVYAGYGLISLLDSFDQISARFEAMAAVYDPAKFTIENDLLPELPGLLELTAAFAIWLEDFRFLLYSRLAWFFAFICISLPLYYIYFQIIHKMQIYRNSISLKTYSSNMPSLGQPTLDEEYGIDMRCPSPSFGSSFRKFIFSDNTHLILAAILSLVHALVEVILMIRFMYVLKKSGNVSAQVTLLSKATVMNNFIFAFTGLFSSWIFFTRSRLDYSRAMSQIDNQVTIVRPATNSLFDTWTITPTIKGEIHPVSIHTMSEVTKQDGYFVRPRPQLKHFPDISSVKSLLAISEEPSEQTHP